MVYGEGSWGKSGNSTLDFRNSAISGMNSHKMHVFLDSKFPERARICDIISVRVQIRKTVKA